MLLPLLWSRRKLKGGRTGFGVGVESEVLRGAGVVRPEAVLGVVNPVPAVEVADRPWCCCCCCCRLGDRVEGVDENIEVRWWWCGEGEEDELEWCEEMDEDEEE